MMVKILVVKHPEDGMLVVDSRLVAKRLDVDHSDWIQNVIKKYQEFAEQVFGSLRFENEVKKRDVGATTEKFVWLTEEQLTFYMTLSKNTLKVVECKAELVRAFFAAKRLLKDENVHNQFHTTVYIRRLENMADHDVPDHLWMTFREGAEVLLMVEKEYRVPVSQMDLCDGSIGYHWSQYRKTQVWKDITGEYIHKFRDKRKERPCKAYEHSELRHFRRWLRENYIPKHLPQYLVDKYGKQAVRQIYEEIGKLDEYIMKITEEKRISPKQDEMYEVFLAAREAVINRYLPDS